MELLFSVLSNEKCPKIINENLLRFPTIHSKFISVLSLTSDLRTHRIPMERPVFSSLHEGRGSPSFRDLGLSSSSERRPLHTSCLPGKQGAVDRSLLQGPPAQEAIYRPEVGSCPNQGPNKHVEFVRRFY